MRIRLTLLAAAGLALAAAMAISAVAQDSSAKPEKKVWTNEDLQALHSTGAASVVGEPQGSPAKRANRTAKPGGDQTRNGQWYRERLQPLYAELAKLDAQMDELRSFQDGSYRASGGVPRGYLTPLNPADKIQELTAQRDKVQARVGALEDEARHNGILPGELR